MVPRRCRLYGIIKTGTVGRVSNVWMSLIAAEPLVRNTLLFNTLAFMLASQAEDLVLAKGRLSPMVTAMTLYRSQAINLIHETIDKGEFSDVLLQCIISMLLADVSDGVYLSDPSF